MWADMQQLTAFECYETLLEDVTKSIEAWQAFMLAEKEHVFDLLPEPYQSSLPYFAWIPLIRCLKPELTTMAIKRYIQKTLGGYFITPIIYHLKEALELSRPSTPLMLILTPGNDPMDQLRKLGEEKQKVPSPVSLGKGQGAKAKQLIMETRKSGGWVILQNCHLGASFLPELAQIVEGLQPQSGGPSSGDMYYDEPELKKQEPPPHPDFRIWLTSMSVDYFPQAILQSSLKITSEPPKGIKPAMIRAYNQVLGTKAEREFYEKNRKFEIW